MLQEALGRRFSLFTPTVIKQGQNVKLFDFSLCSSIKNKAGDIFSFYYNPIKKTKTSTVMNVS